MKADGLLSPLGEMVRRVDPDRYLTALFAPAARREALFTLYAFNHELARAREVVREPFAALIRLQWWREVVEGARRQHEVATPVRAALDAGWLQQRDLDAMIAAREMEAEPFETVADFKIYVMGSAGGVMVAAGHALGWPDAELLRPWGAAYGVAGILRSVGEHARQGRCLLPLDLLQEAGLGESAMVAAPKSAAVTPVTETLRREALQWLQMPITLPRLATAAALPAVFARRDLRPTRGSDRGIMDRLAVTAAGLLGLHC